MQFIDVHTSNATMRLKCMFQSEIMMLTDFKHTKNKQVKKAKRKEQPKPFVDFLDTIQLGRRKFSLWIVVFSHFWLFWRKLGMPFWCMVSWMKFVVFFSTFSVNSSIFFLHAHLLLLLNITFQTTFNYLNWTRQCTIQREKEKEQRNAR